MGTVNLEVSPHEFTNVYTHPDAKVDIVLVHGLGGAPKHTWTAKQNGLFWPAELLPDALGLPPANIIVYGYNSKVYGSPTDNAIKDHAHTLVSHLSAHRKRYKTTRNPIIWIAHSLGGILVKSSLLYSNGITNRSRESLRSIFVSTYAILFLGTPHSGSNVASTGLAIQTWASRFLPRVIVDSEAVLLRTLQANSEVLQDINDRFLEIHHLFQIHMVHENLKTNIGGTKVLIVSADSAGPRLANVTYYGVEANHSDMCKFGSETAPGFRTMVSALQEWVQNSPAAIEERWNIEMEESRRHLRQEIDAQERLAVRPAAPLERASASAVPSIETSYDTAGPRPSVATSGNIVSSPSIIQSHETPVSLLQPPLSTRDSGTSMTSSEQFYLAPDRFRPNSFFVGRDSELAELHNLLRDPSRSSQGTSAVIIYGIHGSGKTHLARQYFFKHQRDFPGGICWVRAKTISELEQAFREIARKDFLREFLNVSGATQADMDDSLKIVEAVRKWFNSREQWLIVFDAISFDTPGIGRFIPDAKHTSIIFTSVRGTASGNYRFDNPQVMRLKMLQSQHAKNLLFQELKRYRPSKEDEIMALDLVKLLGYLPLLVHISAEHIKRTEEPLSKYLRTHKERPRIKHSELHAYTAVYDELKANDATQALDLVYILTYFDSLIPIGLLHLGLQESSDKPRSLGNTLRTLISSALLERTEANSVSPTSSRSSSTHEHALKKPSNAADVLKIHPVVQIFFASLLRDEKRADDWVTKSAAVYCRAFDAAVKLMNKDFGDPKGPQVGILDDYRYFKIHGLKLLEHLKPRTKKSTFAKISSDITERVEKCDAQIALSQPSSEIEDTSMSVSVFEVTVSISDSESSSHASIITPTSSKDTCNLSPEIKGISSRVPTFFDEDERVGPRVSEDNFMMRRSRFSGGFDSPVEPESPWATEFPTRPADKGKKPMTQAELDLEEDLDGSTVFHMSPDPIYSATIPELQRPHPSNYRASSAATGHDRQLSSGHDDADVDSAQATTPRAHNLSPAGTEVYQPQPTIPARYSSTYGQNPKSTAHHRTVNNYTDRRYHKSTESWRVGSDSPRVTVDLHPAKATLFHPRQLLPANTTGTVAENALRALPIRQNPVVGKNPVSGQPSITNSQALGVPQIPSRIRAHSTGALGERPLLPINESYPGLGIYQGQHQSEEVALGRGQPGSVVETKTEKQRSGSASFLSRQVGIFRKLLPSSRRGSSSSASEQQRREHTSAVSTTGSLATEQQTGRTYGNTLEYFDSLPRPVISGLRTSRSSPGQARAPFSTPPYPTIDTMPLSFANAFESDQPSSDLPAAISSWSENTYHPGGSQSLSFNDTDMNETHRRRQLLQSHPNSDGYYSQPMSRATSSHSQFGGRNSTGTVLRRPASISVADEDVQPIYHGRNISNTSSSGTGSGSRARVLSRPVNKMPTLRRFSRSSLTETEPPPCLPDPFGIHVSDDENYRQRERLAARLGPTDTAQRGQAAGVPAAFGLRPQASYQDILPPHSSGPGASWQAGQFGLPGSVAMSPSPSDSGSVLQPQPATDSLLPATGSWAAPSRNTATHTNIYPTQISTVDGNDYAAEPMRRDASGGSARSASGLHGRTSRRNLSYDMSEGGSGTGFTSQPMRRGGSGSRHGSAQSRPNAHPARSSRDWKDNGNGQAGQ